MSHYGKCKHGIYLGGCRECFPLLELTKVGEEIIQELVECFNKDKEMTANELADLIENEDTLWLEPHLNTISTMLRQQAKEIEELRESIKIKERDYNFMKDLAIGSENVIADKDVEIEALKLRELTDEEIDDFTARIYNCRTGEEAYEIVLAILKKASEK
jgi:phosphoribosyl-ATP pyrophosphohydrolase